MRGVLAGLITGLIVSGLVLGTASVVVDLADMAVLRDSAPEADAVAVPPGSGFDAVREDREAALPGAGDSPEAGAAPRVPAPAPDETVSLSGAETAPAEAPATGEATSLAAPPADDAGAGGVAVGGESPVLPSPQAQAPAQPKDEARLSISTDPAQPPSPDPGESGAGLTQPEEEDVGGPEEAAGDPAEETGESGAQAPEPQAPEPQAPEPQAPEPPAPEPQQDESIAAIAPDEGAPEAAPAPRRIVPESGGALTGDRAEGVTTDRLPRIGETPPEDEAAEAAPEPQAALARNAVEAEVPPGKPLMAIVLIDEGAAALGLEALGAFPYPLSIAIPATRADASEAAARYREAGFEVLLAADLPEGAGPGDVETAMAAWLDRVPQAAAVIEGDGTGLQSSREASAQLAPILLETGHGLVMRPNGLDTAQKLIAREGVPSATLFRDFDAQGQNAAAVRRFLDQAAMRAGQQQDGVIMLGRVRADTISALLLWGLQDRAASVALVPVSAVLRQRAAE